MTDFSSNSSKKVTSNGAKAHQRSDKEDRTIEYRIWRRNVGSSAKISRKRQTCYTSDLDQIEYVFHKNIIYPVCILELTRYDFDEYDGHNHSWAKYRSSILDRYFLRDAQGKFIQRMAGLIGCDAYIVLFRHDLESFWLFDLLHKDALWIHKNAEEYQNWLIDLKTKKLETLINAD